MMIKRFLLFLFKLTEKIELGRTVHVYFPVERKFAKVQVTSMHLSTFTGRMDEEPDWLDTLKNYGQIDNDILFDNVTREPLKEH